MILEDKNEVIKKQEFNITINVFPSGKDRIYAFYKMMGMEIEYDEIFADEED